MTAFSPEFRLVAACCRWPPSAERDAAVRARTKGVDWGHFETVIRRHRVEGLVNRAFSDAGVTLPPQITMTLAADATAIARQTLVYAAESRRIAQLLDAAGLTFLFVKGTTLDMRAYGTLGLKRSRDIDVAVAPKFLAVACALLGEAGYDRVVPGPEIGPDRFPDWVRHCKETAWRHERTNVLVELHNGLVDNPELLRGIDVHSPRQVIEIAPGIRLPTLADEELFAYLCVHGATHAWSRLKWLAHLAAFLSHFQAGQVESFYRAAARRGAGRPAAQALLLCVELFEAQLDAALVAELRADRATRMLVAIARRAMNGETELDGTVLGTLPIHLSHFLFGDGLRFKLQEARRKLRDPHDRSALLLPRPLHLLYPVLAMPRWLWRRIRGPTSL